MKTMRYYFSSIRMAIVKIKTKPSVGKHGKIGNLVH
jgi:hypothetical protein